MDGNRLLHKSIERVRLVTDDMMEIEKERDRMANDSLSKARVKKNDEFYTVYDYIQREINAYLEYDPDVFKGKTVLLPCDDPE